jgi:hypothetical protein
MAAPDDLFAVMDRLVAASQAVHDAYKEARATDRIERVIFAGPGAARPE